MLGGYEAYPAKPGPDPKAVGQLLLQQLLRQMQSQQPPAPAPTMGGFR